MNDRQKRYKANRIKGMNQHNAAIAAGYSEKYSRQACRIERLVKVSIADALERAGLTEKYESQKLYELTQSENETIALSALKHVAELKHQVQTGININQTTQVINNKDRIVIFRDVKDDLNGKDISPELYAREGAERNISQEAI